MKATPLFREGSTTPAFWLCGACNYGGHMLYPTQEAAEECCQCDWKGCTERRAEHRCYCAKHDIGARAERDREEARKEAARFAKAKKVTAVEYTGRMVYDPAGRGSGEGYFDGVEDLEEYYHGEDYGLPAYVWATRERKMCSDAGRVVEEAMERAGVNTEDFSPDIASLQKVLDAWWAENSEPYYETDYTTAILVSAEPEGE